MQNQASYLQWTLKVILSGSYFIDIYLKNKNAPRKKTKPVSIEIGSVTFFTIILIVQNTNNYSLNLGRHVKIDRKALSWFKDAM